MTNSKETLDLNKVRIICDDKTQYMRAARFLSFQTGKPIEKSVEKGACFKEYPYVCMSWNWDEVVATCLVDSRLPFVKFEDFDLKSLRRKNVSRH